MPTYGYTCANGHEFERFLPVKLADMKVKCPACKKTGRRQIGAGGGLLFKGKGFYCTENKSDSYKSAKSMHTEMAKMEKRLHADNP